MNECGDRICMFLFCVSELIIVSNIRLDDGYVFLPKHSLVIQVQIIKLLVVTLCASCGYASIVIIYNAIHHPELNAIVLF